MRLEAMFNFKFIRTGANCIFALTIVVYLLIFECTTIPRKNQFRHAFSLQRMQSWMLGGVLLTIRPLQQA